MYKYDKDIFAILVEDDMYFIRINSNGINLINNV